MKQLLKLSFLLLCNFVCNTYVQGQNPNLDTLTKQNESAVYFASGSSELSSEAIEDLNLFLKDQSNLESREFRLQAFTDDVGSPERNALLAQNRAAQVQAYLSKQSISIHTIKIQAFQQLHLNPDENVTEQRANNRRVVVELWGISKETTNDLVDVDALKLERFLNRDPKEYQQNFSFNAAKGTVLEGEKGTVLQIPANCFVDSEGNVVTGEISFLLQEAYSYSDMLFQNLSTVSNGEILETGGMLFIEAKDEAGNVLAIQEGAEITAAMASTAAKMPKMQTFEGVVDSITNSVDWVATNQSVRSGNQNYASVWERGMGNVRGRLYQKSSLGENLTGLPEVPVWELKLPKEVEKPRLKIRVPKYPRLKKTMKPSKEALVLKNPQKSNLPDLKYKKKIREKYALLQKSYRKKVQSNTKKKNTYKRDSIAYERALAKHEKNVLKYNLYNQNMRIVLDEMYEVMTNFSFESYRSDYYKLRTFAWQFRQRNSLMSGGTQFIQAELNQKTVYDSLAQPLLVKLNNADLMQFTEEECQLIETCWSNKLGKKISSASLRLNYNRNQFKSNRYRVANIYNRACEKGNLKSYRLSQIRKMKTRVDELYNYKRLNRIDEDVQEKQKKTLPLITRFLKKEKATIDLEKEFLEVKTKLNILTPADVVDIYSNAMRIQNAGWINCDRFINSSNFTTLEVVMEQTKNTHVVVVFEGAMKSMMSAFPDQEGFKVNRIPADRDVKIIGFRVIGDAMEVFVEEGTVRKLKGVKPTFKKKTVEEVEAMMLAI
jgi:hypothetical protein